MAREKDEAERERIAENNKKKITGCLDPLTKTLTSFENEEDLMRKIDDIYDRLDFDGSGGLNFDEFREGIKTLPGAHSIHLTRDDFDMLTENGKHLNNGEFGQMQFRDMMRGELLRFSGRELVNVLAFSESDEFKSTVVMLKIMDTKVAKAVRDSQETLLHAMAAHFNKADADGSGFVDYGEFVNMECNQGLSDEELKARFARLDVNRDGQLDLHEFAKQGMAAVAGDGDGKASGSRGDGEEEGSGRGGGGGGRGPSASTGGALEELTKMFGSLRNELRLERRREREEWKRFLAEEQQERQRWREAQQQEAEVEQRRGREERRREHAELMRRMADLMEKGLPLSPASGVHVKAVARKSASPSSEHLEKHSHNVASKFQAGNGIQYKELNAYLVRSEHTPSPAPPLETPGERQMFFNGFYPTGSFKERERSPQYTGGRPPSAGIQLGGMCVCARVCVCMCVRARVHVCVPYTQAHAHLDIVSSSSLLGARVRVRVHGRAPWALDLDAALGRRTGEHQPRKAASSRRPEAACIHFCYSFSRRGVPERAQRSRRRRRRDRWWRSHKRRRTGSGRRRRERAIGERRRCG